MTRCHAMLAIALLAFGAPSASAAQELTGWRLGATWSNMVTSYPNGSSQGNTSRRLVSVEVRSLLSDRRLVQVETGLRGVAKGFNVSGPTIHAEYLEVPLELTFRGNGSGPYLALGSYLGVRVLCRRWARTVWGMVRDGCGRTPTPVDWDPLRRWDLGVEGGFGWRFRNEAGGIFMVGVELAGSVIDIEPDDHGRRWNVAAIWMGFELPQGAP